MASRRKPRPPQASAANYLFAAAAASPRPQTPPLAGVIGRTAAPRSPRNFQEFLSAEEDSRRPPVVHHRWPSSDPDRPTLRLEKVSVVRASCASQVYQIYPPACKVSAAYTRRPTNDTSLRRRQMIKQQSAAATKSSYGSASVVSCSASLEGAGALRRGGPAGGAAGARAPPSPKPRLWSVLSSPEALFSILGADDTRRWTVAHHDEIRINHKPYVPEASLSRPARQQTSQRVQLAVTQWAEEQQRVSHVHRRIFAAFRREPAEARPIRNDCRAVLRLARAKGDPVARPKPRPADKIGAPLEPRPFVSEASSLLRVRAESDELPKRPVPLISISSSDTPSELLAVETGDSSSYAPSPLELGSAEAEPAPPPPSRSTEPLKQSEVSQAQKNFANGQKLSSRDRLDGEPPPVPIKPGGGGMSAVFAAIRLGGAEGSPTDQKRRPRKTGKTTEPADPMYGPEPPVGLVARRLNWLPLRPAQLAKTIWNSLLQDDFNQRGIGISHQCGTVINGKGLCGGIFQCHMTPPDTYTARAISSRASSTPVLNRSTQPGMSEQMFDPSLIPVRIDPDYKALDAHFFSSPAKSAAISESTRKGKPQGILDQRRILNLQIALKGLGIYDDKLFIVQTVLDMNTVEVHRLIEMYKGSAGSEHSLRTDALFGGIPRIKTPRPDVDASFTTELCGVIVKLVPTPDEIELLRQADVNDLTLAEQHLLEWSSVSRFAEKLECLSTVSNFVEIYGRISGLASQMLDASDKVLNELRNGQSLKAVLALILKCGNYLNYSRRKFALAVQYSSLDLLRRTPSFDDSTTLLRHVSGAIDSQWPALWTVLDAALAPPAPALSLKDLRGQLSSLEQMARKICIEVTQHGKEHNELFVAVLSIFLDVSASQIAKLTHLTETLEHNLLELAQFFVHEVADAEEGVDVLKFIQKFYRDMVVARDQQREAGIRARMGASRRARAPLR